MLASRCHGLLIYICFQRKNSFFFLLPAILLIRLFLVVSFHVITDDEYVISIIYFMCYLFIFPPFIGYNNKYITAKFTVSEIFYLSSFHLIRLHYCNIYYYFLDILSLLYYCLFVFYLWSLKAVCLIYELGAWHIYNIVIPITTRSGPCCLIPRVFSSEFIFTHFPWTLV